MFRFIAQIFQRNEKKENEVFRTQKNRIWIL